MKFRIFDHAWESAASMIDEDGDESAVEVPSKEPLGQCAVLCYGVGHMLNDITSSCWFTYLLLFLTEIGLSPSNAAVVILSGQGADAFATIFAGELIDRFGHFKLWHTGGSVLVAISFSSVFGGCLLCQILGTQSVALETVGYSIFAAIFNVGWAVTQVAHMSMVNCITLNPTSRVVLSSCRNAFTMVANLSLYAIALAVFSLYKADTPIGTQYQYRWIAYASIFIGACFVIIFLAGTREPRWKLNNCRRYHQRISWAKWFKKVLYYQVAAVYMLMRLATNVSQALLTFFVINDLQMTESSKALVPAVIYIFSFVVSIALQKMKWSGRRLKVAYTIGAILWIFCGAGIVILPSNLNQYMYLLSVIIGVANALMTVTSISMGSFLVGEDLNGSAFVYASFGFLDKASCGVALYLIESYQGGTLARRESCMNAAYCPPLAGHIPGRSASGYGLGILPAVCALIGILVTCSMDLHEADSTPLIEPLLV